MSLIRKRNDYTTLLAAITLDKMGQKFGVDTLKKLGYKTTDAAIRGLRVLKTKISLGLAKVNKKSVKGDYSIYKDAVMLEQILGRTIDLDKTVVTYWVELNKLAKELNKPKGKNKRK